MGGGDKSIFGLGVHLKSPPRSKHGEENFAKSEISCGMKEVSYIVGAYIHPKTKITRQKYITSLFI